MPTFYNWSLKRSGAAIRVYGDARQNGAEIRGHKIGNIGKVEMAAGKLVCYSRDTREPVCHLNIA